MTKILNVDGDILLHMFASVGEERSILVTHKPSGRVKEFKGRQEFRGRIKKDGTCGGWLAEVNKMREEKGQLAFPLEDFGIEDKQVAQPLEHSIYALKQHLKSVKNSLGCSDVQLYLGDGSKCHRHDILLPWEGEDGQGRRYKAQRSGLIKPVHLDGIRHYLTHNLKANIISGIEVDDKLAMLNWEGHQKYLKTGNKDDNPYLCLTVDKDACGTDGWLMNPNWMDKPMYIEGLGEMWKDPSGKIRMTGKKSLYGQLLSQDVVDNIHPKRTPNGKTNRYSETQMFTDLVDLKTDQECWALIVEKYKEWFGEEEIEYKAWDGSRVKETWVSWLQKHYDLYKMLRWEGDVVLVNNILLDHKLI